MKYFCKGCGTESLECAICSGCGSIMTQVSDEHLYILEIIDQVVSKEVNQAVVYERRGPFNSVDEATQWWERHHAHEKYVGCTGTTALLDPPIHFSDGDDFSN